MRRIPQTLLALALVPLLVACDGLETTDPSVGPPDNGDPAVGLDPDLGKPLLGVALDAAKDDSANGYQGPLASGLATNTRVWSVTRQWNEVSTEAGLAWPANSGLNWEHKYSAWVGSLDGALSDDGHNTFNFTTPWGRTLPAARLECAEVAMFLRATFASWYGLPFYLSAYSPTHGQLFFGHFGIVTATGASPSAYPSFATAYTDHTSQFAGQPNATILANWPSDSNLRTRALTTLKDDYNGFLGADAYAGAYFDQIFLNKRVGHFLLRLLTNLGSMHLVDSNRNTFNLKPEAIRPGDVLLQRWQAQGIGHTVIVLRTDWLSGSTVEVQTAFGSMPRIQPRWYGPNLSRSYFTSPYSGGPGVNGDGAAYASLGGGLKRWRQTIFDGTRWRNIIPASYTADWIDSSDLDTVAARTTHFETLLGQLTNSQKRALYLSQIEDARQALTLRPASCASRTRREQAFERLYELNAQAFNTNRLGTDREHRTLADYVFAELVYNQSKTCCWNQSTSAMHDIIMTYNEERVHDNVSQTCNEPVVFKARNGGYSVFADYAAQIGLASEWRAWSADETCPQSSVTNDTEAAHGWTAWCTVRDDVLGLNPGGGNTGGDTGGGDTGGDTSGGDTGGGNTGGDTSGGSTGGGSSGGGGGKVWQCSGGPAAPLFPALLVLGFFALGAFRRSRRSV